MALGSVGADSLQVTPSFGFFFGAVMDDKKELEFFKSRVPEAKHEWAERVFPTLKTTMNNPHLTDEDKTRLQFENGDFFRARFYCLLGPTADTYIPIDLLGSVIDTLNTSEQPEHTEETLLREQLLIPLLLSGTPLASELVRLVLDYEKTVESSKYHTLVEQLIELKGRMGSLLPPDGFGQCLSTHLGAPAFRCRRRSSDWRTPYELAVEARLTWLLDALDENEKPDMTGEQKDTTAQTDGCCCL